MMDKKTTKCADMLRGCLEYPPWIFVTRSSFFATHELMTRPDLCLCCSFYTPDGWICSCLPQQRRRQVVVHGAYISKTSIHFRALGVLFYNTATYSNKKKAIYIYIRLFFSSQ
jgi:hypothetical protein